MATSVLLADDSAIVRKVAREYLETAGFQVYEADDGVDAVKMAPALEPDSAVLDLVMPHMNGFDAARMLHKLMPRMRLIVFTFYKDILASPEAPDIGIEAVVSKSDGLDALAAHLLKAAPG